MDKIIIKMKDVANIDTWKKSAKLGKDYFANNFIPPFKDIELYVVEPNLTLKCYYKGNYINFYPMVDGRKCGSFRARISDMKIIKSNAKTLANESVPAKTLSDFAGFYFLTMAYISMYKKSVEPKERKVTKSKHKRSKKKETYFTYLINSHYHSEYQGGHHASPSYSFKVRGHYRHLKNGKRIWVREYVKGKDKPKEKVYKL